jgi:hypothetical protein
MIHLSCVKCHRGYVVHPKFAGRTMRCAVCSAEILIPGIDGSTPTPEGRQQPSERRSAVGSAGVFPDSSARRHSNHSAGRGESGPRPSSPRESASLRPASDASMQGVMEEYQKGMDQLHALLVGSLIFIALWCFLLYRFPYIRGIEAIIMAVIGVFACGTSRGAAWVNYAVVILFGCLAILSGNAFVGLLADPQKIPADPAPAPLVVLITKILFGISTVFSVCLFWIGLKNIIRRWKVKAAGIELVHLIRTRELGIFSKIIIGFSIFTAFMYLLIAGCMVVLHY